MYMYINLIKKCKEVSINKKPTNYSMTKLIKMIVSTTATTQQL